MTVTDEEKAAIATAVVDRLKREFGFNPHNITDQERWARVPDDIRYLGHFRTTVENVSRQTFGAVITAAAVAVAAAVWLVVTGRGGQ